MGPWMPTVADLAAPRDRRLSPIVRIAPAKLNLTLAVLGRRADGFHDLHSVLVPLALADRLSVAPAGGAEDTLSVAGHPAGPLRENLVLRAIAASRAAVGRAVEPVPLAARLEKLIPVAAGLGGGSSDAAAAIEAAFDLWGVAARLGSQATADLRHRVAISVGSDVAFFLSRGPAVLSGRGDVVEPLPPLRGAAPGVLLVAPAVPVPTPDVFAALDLDPRAAPADPGSTRAASAHLAGEWQAGLHAEALFVRAGVLASANDLALAADIIVPGLRALRRALVRTLGRPVGLSGSGPTLWVLYASATEAAAAAAAVEAGVADGTIVAPGAGQPFIVATTIAAAEVPAVPGSEEETGP